MSKTCLVTGASRGLGLEIARALLANGHSVVATARSIGKLEGKFEHVDQLQLAALDITDAATIASAVEAAVEKFGGIEVLVNNAGHGQLGHFEMTREADVRSEFDVNLFGPMAVTRAVLPHMRARRSGLLVTISSSSGLTSSPGGSIYSASKFAIEGWIDGLAQELEPFGIRSLIVEPGMMRTDFLDPNSARYADIAIADYAEAAAGFRAFIDDANHKQLNDPVRLAAHIACFIDDEDRPARFVFGDDAIGWIGENLDALRGDIKRSGEISAEFAS